MCVFRGAEGVGQGKVKVKRGRTISNRRKYTVCDENNGKQIKRALKE